ncbi:hypothetical protein OAR00_02590, partial [Alphaproteobacteria bacterium]|nr:hypothetical protein [Alphaproteobacteria bacterium]
YQFLLVVKIEVINQTKNKLENLILSRNQNLKSSNIIKRNQQYLNNIKDNSLIYKAFEINNKKINFFNYVDGVIAIKVTDRKVEDYKINPKINDELNSSLSKSFFNDFSNYYINNLATKHKLVRNYSDLENYLLNTENNK